MTQEIKIGVAANTSGAEAAIGKVEDAASGAAQAMGGVGATARLAAGELEDVAGQAERVARAVAEIQRQRKLLSQQIGHDISLPDTAQFLSNFERMRSGGVRGVGRAVRESAGFEDWAANHQRSFVNPADAARHRQRILQYGMQGTSHAAQPPAPPPGQPPGQPPAPPAPGGGGSNIVQRAQSSALGFGKSMLALAGLGGAVAMAGKSADLYGEESTGIDTLKRRAGDLGVSFEKLQQETRAAGDGLGITYIESVKLAQEYAKVSGKFKNAAGVRTAEGFSRSFGLDPSTSVQFFAAMQRMKTPGTDEQGSRRLALMIGEAVVKGGYGGKADEVMESIAGLAGEMTKATLGAPNISAIAGYLTTLTKSGFPGLDPQGAAALLGQADASVRRGGGMGDASLNFSYAALSKASPGLGVVGAGALWQAGLFGTTRGVFGQGKDGKYNSPVGEWYAKNGLATPGLNDTTNLTKQMALMHQQYGGKGKEYMLDAMKNHFGVSYEQAAALDLMNESGPEKLGESARLVSAAGLDMRKISASGIQGIGRVAAATTPGEMKGLYNDVKGRKDLTDKERTELAAAFKLGGQSLKEALVKVIGTHEQEETEGSKTRQSIASLQDVMTRAGAAVVAVLNPIRSAVDMLAQTLAPEKWKEEQQRQKDEKVNYAEVAEGEGWKPTAFANRFKQAGEAYDAAGGGYGAVDKAAPYPKVASLKSGDYALDMTTRRFVSGLAGAQGLKFTPSQRARLDEIQDPKERTFLEGLLRTENRGLGTPQDKRSPKGAQGYAQFMPSTWSGTTGKDGKFHPGYGDGLDIHDFGDNVTAMRRYYRDLHKRFKGNPRAMAAEYNGGIDQGRRIEKGLLPDKVETIEYDAIMGRLGAYGDGPQDKRSPKGAGTPIPPGAPENRRQSAGTPLPAGDPAGKIDRDKAAAAAHVTFGGEVNLPVKDQHGNQHGTASLMPFVSKPPAGQKTWADSLTK